MEEEPSTSLNPLECGVCQQEFDNPVHLPCLHVFCRGCVGNSRDGEPSACPECFRPIGEAPPTDLLAKYLIDTAHEAAEVCANCDQSSTPMYFCETCQQALCQECRQNTHQAKMFSSHRLISLEERARVRGRVSCAPHGEPYILFCVDEKRLVCIQCFHGRPLEARHSFVSIDNAHAANVEKLEKWANRLRLFQEEKREEVDVRTRMLHEVQQRFTKEHTAVFGLCQEIVDTVCEVRDRIIGEMEKERSTVEAECRTQMAELSAVMTPIRLYLLSAQILCSSASKIDFLQFYSDLVKRIQAVLLRSGGRPPNCQWKDSESARSELSKALEGKLGLASPWMHPREAREGSGSASCKSRGSGLSLPSFGFQGVLTKYQIMVDLAGAFGEQFSRIDEPLKDMTVELSVLSRRVQETQRDLTMRRCLIKGGRIDDLIKSCTTVDSRLGMHSALISDLQPELQELWQEALDRVRRQQILYREKMETCIELRNTARQVVTAARQLAPFARCLENMTALIDPRRCHPPDPAPMESICLQISTIEPDSERRIQAIEEEENNRRLVQEAKRKEQEAERTAVGKLHKAKGKKKSHLARLMLNTNRERSPGGTDATLTSPCTRQRSSPSLREETLSDLEYGCELGEESDEADSTAQAKIEHGSAEEPSKDGGCVAGKGGESPLAPIRVDTRETDPLRPAALSEDYVRRPVWHTDTLSKAHSIPGLRSPSPTTVSTIEQFLFAVRPNGSHPNYPPDEAESNVSKETAAPPSPLGVHSNVEMHSPSDALTMRGKSRRKTEPVREIVGARNEVLAGRITADVGGSRDCVLRELHDVFSARAEEDTDVIEQPNMLASAVKMADRRLRDTRDKDGEKGRGKIPTKAKRDDHPRKKATSIGGSPEDVAIVVEDKEENSALSATSPPPPPPNGPSALKETVVLRPFEAREKMLESLREKVPRIDATPEPEEHPMNGGLRRDCWESE